MEFVKKYLVFPFVCTFNALIFTTIGKSFTAFPSTRQCWGGKSLAIDFTVSLSTLEAFETVSKSRSFVKLNRNMLSAWRYMLSRIESG